MIFSKRFWSGGEHYPVDPSSGKIDMSGYGRDDYYRFRGPGYANFDYGYYDAETNSWWHANHSEPGMKVYQSTLEHFSRAYLGFDTQIFCVAIPEKELP